MKAAPSFKSRPVELVAIVNSFNRRELLEKAIASLASVLRKATFGSAIIVFDAGSTDDSNEFLCRWAEQNPADDLIVLTSPEARSSFAHGVNTACCAALTRFPECRWLFLFETDNWLDSIKPVEQAISLTREQPRLAAVGFTVKRHSGVFCGYGMRFPSYLSLAAGQNLSALFNLNAPNDSQWMRSGETHWRTCDVVFTSPLLIRREAWEQTQGFDAEGFPFSESDLDWAWRCAGLGWELAVIAAEGVVHDNLQQPSAWSAHRVIDFHRARFRLLKRHRGKRVALLKPLLFVRHALETILLACGRRSDPNAKARLAHRKEMLRTVWTDYS